MANAGTEAKDVAQAVGQLHRSLGVLDQPTGADASLHSRIDEARARGQRFQQSVEAVLGPFELLGVDIA